MTIPVLSIEGVSKAAPEPGLGVIRRLDLEIRQGEVLSLLGMGSWERRTLVDLVTALASPDDGTIRFQGTDLGTKKERDLNPLRGRMGVVTDPPVFLGNLRIMENLRLPLRYQVGGDEQTIDKRLRMLLEKLGLTDFPDVIPSRFDARFLGKAALVRALSVSPDLFIIDRPLETLGEDLAFRLREIWREHVTDHGGGVLVLTTVPRLALALSDRVALYENKEITAVEKREDFQARMAMEGLPEKPPHGTGGGVPPKDTPDAGKPGRQAPDKG